MIVQVLRDGLQACHAQGLSPELRSQLLDLAALIGDLTAIAG